MVTVKSSSAQAIISSKDDYWAKQIFGNRCLFPWMFRKRFWGVVFGEINPKFLSWCQRLLEGILSKWEYSPWWKIIKSIISLCFSYVFWVTSRLQDSVYSERKRLGCQCFGRTHWISYTVDCSKPGNNEVELCDCLAEASCIPCCIPSQNRDVLKCTGLLSTMGWKQFSSPSLWW